MALIACSLTICRLCKYSVLSKRSAIDIPLLLRRLRVSGTEDDSLVLHWSTRAYAGLSLNSETSSSAQHSTANISGTPYQMKSTFCQTLLMEPWFIQTFPRIQCTLTSIHSRTLLYHGDIWLATKSFKRSRRCQSPG